MKKYAIGIIALALSLAVALWVWDVRTVKAPTGEQACTQEARICPDGSAVGRTGPNCEFSACPSTDSSIASSTTTLAIGERGTAGGKTISALELIEDSRCPMNVQCIQAGTVRVRASVDSYNKDLTFTLNQPQVVGNATITLSSVTPAQKFSTQTVQRNDYRFTFIVVPEVTIITTGVRGVVSLGPTCPVERIPPDPACAEKPYATAIVVYRIGSQSVFVVGNSDTNGMFKFSLPPGSYTLEAKNGKVFPRCTQVSVDVSANGYASTVISCDTGIR